MCGDEVGMGVGGLRGFRGSVVGVVNCDGLMEAVGGGLARGGVW